MIDKHKTIPLLEKGKQSLKLKSKLPVEKSKLPVEKPKIRIIDVGEADQLFEEVSLGLTQFQREGHRYGN